MKPEEAIVGQIYKHKDYPNSLYVGIKNGLILIKDNNETLIGKTVALPHETTSYFWNGFYKDKESYEIDENDFEVICY